MSKISSKHKSIDDLFFEYNEKYTELIDVFSPLNWQEKKEVIKEYEQVYLMLEDCYIRGEVNQNTAEQGTFKWVVFQFKLKSLTELHESVIKD